MVPVVARHQQVRAVMRERQRELGDKGDVVIEGRDIGTVVAPNAAVKVYLIADESERARRRAAERPEIGADALATDLRLRDESDAAQMEPAADAERIDTTGLTVEDVVARIEQLVEHARARRARPTSTSPGRRAPRSAGSPVPSRRPQLRRRAGPAHGRHRARLQPLLLDRPAALRCPLPAHDPLRRQGRGAPRSGARPADPRLRHDLGATRRVRPRGGPADARGGAGRDMRSASSSRARGSCSGVPGHAHPGAAMVALQEGVPVEAAADPRLADVAARQLPPGLDRLGRADRLLRAAAEREGVPRGLRRDRARAAPALGMARPDARARPAGRRPCPPRDDEPARNRRDRRLPERRQVHARQPPHRRPAPRSSTRPRA